MSARKIALDVSSEANRIVENMTYQAGYHGTTSPDVVDEILSRFSNPIFCWGQARNMVFTPITTRTYSFKTEAA